MRCSGKRTSLVVALTAICLSLSGCIILPLPGKEVPVESSGRKLVDARFLCGKGNPINVGAKREAVHDAVGVDDAYFGSKQETSKPQEDYHFENRAGASSGWAPIPKAVLLE